MQLEEAITAAIDKFGVDVLTEKRLNYILTDYQAYDNKATQRIILTMLEKGYLLRLYKVPTNNPATQDLEYKQIVYSLNKEGFQTQYIEAVLEACALAFQWQRVILNSSIDKENYKMKVADGANSADVYTKYALQPKTFSLRPAYLMGVYNILFQGKESLKTDVIENSLNISSENATALVHMLNCAGVVKFESNNHCRILVSSKPEYLKKITSFYHKLSKQKQYKIEETLEKAINLSYRNGKITPSDIKESISCEKYNDLFEKLIELQIITVDGLVKNPFIDAIDIINKLNLENAYKTYTNGMG